MKKIFWLFVILSVQRIPSFSQSDVPLFHSKAPLNLQITGSIKSIKKKTNDSTFVTGKFMYEDAPEKWVEVPAQARVRGNFRLKNCYFPPLKVKFNKKTVEQTVFDGNKALKLVLPCLTSKGKNELIRKEYLCYQFNELLSPYYFRTRLANVKLTEVSRKNPREFDMLSFFVEDNSMVAKRVNGKIMETRSLSPIAFEEKNAVRNDFFQYMIGNADWSAVYQHNANVMYVDKKYVTLSYDFDMSGFVNASYAEENAPTLGTGDVRERVYRGYCKTPATMEAIRKEFLDKETAIQALVDSEAANFNKSELNDMHFYLDQFFKILRNDDIFKSAILEGCRKL